MHDMYTNDTETESPAKRAISSGAKAIGIVLGLGFMWFAYTSVLPNVPVIGPILEATAKPPLADIGVTVKPEATDFRTEQTEDLLVPGATPQEMDIKDAATHARFIRQMEGFYGGSLASLGYTDEAFIADSYGWCASIQAYGPTEANRIQTQELRSRYTPDQVEMVLPMIRAGNKIIEQSLCS